MKVIEVKKNDKGKYLGISHMEADVTKAYQIKVKVMCSSLTTGDLASLHMKKKNIGQFYTGLIVEVGEKVNEFSVGQRVIGICNGAYSEFIIVHKDSMIIHLPDEVTYSDGVALLFGGTTSLYFIRRAIKVNKLHKVLVNGASGEVGVICLQLLKAYGHHVTSVSREENFALLKELGSDQCLDYTKENVKEFLSEYDLVFDAVGKLDISNLDSMSGQATFVSTQLNINLLKAKILSKFKRMPSVIFGIARSNKSDIETLLNLYLTGNIKPIIDSRITLETINKGVSRVKSGRKIGSIVIEIAKEKW